jgi:hypothetical protein
MTTLVRLLGVSILAIGLSARAVPPTSIPPLKIGDRAPVLESISWLQGNPVKKTMSETWVTASGSLGAPTAAIVDRRGKLVWIGYPNVPKGYTFDQALADTLNGKIDLERSRALQAETIKETAKYWATKSQESPWPPGKP